MPTSAEAGVMPAFTSASFTASRDSAGVTMYHAEPSSFISSAPASEDKLLDLVSRFFGNADFAFAVKHPAYGAGFRHVATILAHQVAKFADDSIAIGSDHLNQKSNPARAV